MKAITFFIILFILGILYLVIFSSFFKIKEIIFTGEEPNCTTRDEIKKASGVIGENTLFIKVQTKEKRIKDKFICIRAASFYNSIPDRLKIDIKNRKAALTLVPAVPDESIPIESESSESAKPKQIGQAILVDDEGVIFAIDEGQSNQPSVFVIGLDLSEKVFDQKKVQKTLQILDKLRSLGINFDDPTIYSEHYLSLGKKPKIVFELREIQDRQLASLQLILDQAKIDTKEVEFIDLRFDKPVVKYGQGQSNMRN